MKGYNLEQIQSPGSAVKENVSKHMFSSKVDWARELSRFTVIFCYEKLKHILFYKNIGNTLLSKTLLCQASILLWTVAYKTPLRRTNKLGPFEQSTSLVIPLHPHLMH